MGCLFLCYDVICKYWPWAKRVEANPKLSGLFQGMTTEVRAFLSRMHAVAHIWKCFVSLKILFIVCTYILVLFIQILWVGHWKQGAAATIGEEQEQVNSYVSQLGFSSHHMTKSGNVPFNQNPLNRFIIFIYRIYLNPQYLTTYTGRRDNLTSAFFIGMREK